MNDIIHIYWEGPIPFSMLPDNEEIDFGIYQIYGSHPVYGNNSLLYIGQTETTFKKRLKDESWHWTSNHSTVTYYLGRIGVDSIKLPISELLDIVEKILIVAHSPSYNARHVQDDLNGINDYRIFNWDNYNMLLPEVSVERYSPKYWDAKKYSNKTIRKK